MHDSYKRYLKYLSRKEGATTSFDLRIGLSTDDPGEVTYADQLEMPWKQSFNADLRKDPEGWDLIALESIFAVFCPTPVNYLVIWDFFTQRILMYLSLEEGFRTFKQGDRLFLEFRKKVIAEFRWSLGRIEPAEDISCKVG